MLRVEADLYSGRPNPSWVIRDEATVRELLRVLTLDRGIIDSETGKPQSLGFRGLVVRIIHEAVAGHYRTNFSLPTVFRVAGGSAPNESGSLEFGRRLVDLMPLGEPSLGGEGLLDEGLQRFLRGLIETERPFQFHRSRPGVAGGVRGVPPGIDPGACSYDAGPFWPGQWNDDPTVLANNNCYNYACCQITNTFAQPGRSAGYSLSENRCDVVSEGAHLDGNHSWGDCWPQGTIGTYLMALVVWPGPAGSGDFHWYRYSSEGFWAHKPGSTPVRNYDNSGNIIYDPETCDRGPYSDFCGYFQTGWDVNIV